MVAVLAVVSLVVTAMLRKRLPPRIAQWSLLGIVVFELCFYNMNQLLNCSNHDPRKYLSHELASGRARTLQFLRSDRSRDFRVGAFVFFLRNGTPPNFCPFPRLVALPT